MKTDTIGVTRVEAGPNGLARVHLPDGRTLLAPRDVEVTARRDEPLLLRFPGKEWRRCCASCGPGVWTERTARGWDEALERGYVVVEGSATP